MPEISLISDTQFLIRPSNRCQFHQHLLSIFYFKKVIHMWLCVQHVLSRNDKIGKRAQNVSEIDYRSNLLNPLRQLEASEIYSNVKIIAKNSNSSYVQMTSNCAVMSSASKLLRNVFECPCSGCDYVVICPDFEVENLKKVVELIHTGSTDVCRQDLKSIQGILRCLQIDDQIITSDLIEIPGVHDEVRNVAQVQTNELVGLDEEREVDLMIPPPNDVHVDKNDEASTIVVDNEGYNLLFLRVRKCIKSNQIKHLVVLLAPVRHPVCE
jgi:hypothetical protein